MSKEISDENRALLIKFINYTFESAGRMYAGNQIRAFLQTATDFRDSTYEDLTDEEFEALLRVYRFFWKDGDWLDQDSSRSILLNTSECLDNAKTEIGSAICASDIFPAYAEKAKVKVFGSAEFDFH